MDYTHPALGGGFGDGFKVVAGYDFVGNHWNSSESHSKPEPKNDPLDNCGKNSKASGKEGEGNLRHLYVEFLSN